MKSLTKYIKKRKAALNFLLEKSRSKYTPSTFHKLRVEIKKLNSLFDLINFCSNDFKRKATYKPFKLIFSQAGKVRELQVEESILKKYLLTNSIKDYSKTLKLLQSKEKEDFFLLVNKKLFDQLNKKYKKIIPYISGIDIEKANRYLKKRKSRIQKLLGKEIIQKKQLHELRKRLKVFNYNREILCKEQDKTLLKNDDLPVLLGKWHDCQVIRKHLKKTIDNCKFNENDINQLKVIKTKIVLDREKLFKEISISIPESEFFIKK